MLVKLNEGFELDSESITTYLGEKLEAYKVPKYVVAVDEIARTFNGKIDRKKIIKDYNN